MELPAYQWKPKRVRFFTEDFAKSIRDNMYPDTKNVKWGNGPMKDFVPIFDIKYGGFPQQCHIEEDEANARDAAWSLMQTMVLDDREP